MNKYILVDKTPVIENDLLKWAEVFENSNKVVDKTTIDDATVSTVFLGVDHNFHGGEPLLFETMVFGGPFNQQQRRYSTWEQAQAGHDEFCKEISENGAPVKFYRSKEPIETFDWKIFSAICFTLIVLLIIKNIHG